MNRKGREENHFFRCCFKDIWLEKYFKDVEKLSHISVILKEIRQGWQYFGNNAVGELLVSYHSQSARRNLMNDIINNINCGISEKRFVNVRNKHCHLSSTKSYRRDAVEQLTSLLKHGAVGSMSQTIIQ